MKKSKTVLRQETKAFEKAIAISDARIAAALENLQAHHRGQIALRHFKLLATGPAQGLDNGGLNALKTLLDEWSKGRRDFLRTIPDESNCPVTGPVSMDTQPQTGQSTVGSSTKQA
jgi:hypothetical protein